MFVDSAVIEIESGQGGNGIVAWLREKYVPNGGPAGGDGGRGGSVYLEATHDLQTLMDFQYTKRFKAQDGERGRPKNMSGKGGNDLTIKVPCGTIVRDVERDLVIADLQSPGDRVMVAQGGRGGRGNARFASNKRRAPYFAEPGEASILRTLSLELKTLADVGIVGLPNAGKSTLISVLSAAKPKIADYPFTTLTPNLGVVKRPSGDGVVLADIPGLIEGASEGHGLGHEFLRHVERTRLLLHLVDMADMSGEDPMDHYVLINKELQKYADTLARKKQLVVLTKADAVLEEDAEALRQRIEAHHQDRSEAVPPIYVISSVGQMGLDILKDAIFDAMDNLPDPDPVVTVVAEDTGAIQTDDGEYTVERVTNDTFVVDGRRIHRWLQMTQLDNHQSMLRFMSVLKAMGVIQALEKAGIEPGHDIRIGKFMFEYYPDTMSLEEIEAMSDGLASSFDGTETDEGPEDGEMDGIEVVWTEESSEEDTGEDAGEESEGEADVAEAREEEGIPH